MAALLALLFMVGLALLATAIDGKTQETREGARAALVVIAVVFLGVLGSLSKPAHRGPDRDIHARGGAYSPSVTDWTYTGGGHGSMRFEPPPYVLGSRSSGSVAAPNGIFALPQALGSGQAHKVGADRGGDFALPPRPADRSGGQPRPATDVAAVERAPLNAAAPGDASFVGVQEWVPALSPVRE